MPTVSSAPGMAANRGYRDNAIPCQSCDPTWRVRAPAGLSRYSDIRYLTVVDGGRSLCLDRLTNALLTAWS
jgi:hypothetical protein